jgi:hypothetical protein
MTVRITLSFLTLVAFAASALAADHTIGTWKRNIEKSKSTSSAPNPLKSSTMVREATADGGVQVTSTGVRQDGTNASWTYTAKYDGTDYPVRGDAPFDTIAIKQVDANTITSTAYKKGGKYRTTGRSVVSKDGKTYTLTAKGTDQNGKPFDQTIVYEKQ